MRKLLVVFGLFVVSVVPMGDADARGRRGTNPPVDPELQAIVDPLIKKLDDPSFEEREKATLALLEIGPRARPALLPARDHASAEVRDRISRILLHYREIERQEDMGYPAADDWSTLKRGPGRRASSGLTAIRKEPNVKWVRILGRPIGRPYFDSPLLATRSLLFVIDRAGKIAALDWATGKVLREYETGGPVLASPVLAGDTLYVPGTSLTAIDARTGRIQWRWKTDYGVSAAPLVHEGHVFAVEKGEKLVSLDPQTGEVEWRARVRATSSTPVRCGPAILVGAEDGLWAFHHEKGTRRWHYETEYPVVSSPATLDDYVIFGDEGRTVHAITAARGTRVWNRRFADGALREAPVVYGDAVYFSTTGGKFRALRAADGSDMWQRSVGSYLQSSPCVAGGAAYFTAGTRLFALECASGDDLWRMDLTAGFSAPILIDGTLFVVAIDGTVVALE